jgi:hypothetical protein
LLNHECYKRGASVVDPKMRADFCKAALVRSATGDGLSSRAWRRSDELDNVGFDPHVAKRLTAVPN